MSAMRAGCNITWEETTQESPVAGHLQAVYPSSECMSDDRIWCKFACSDTTRLPTPQAELPLVHAHLPNVGLAARQALLIRSLQPEV